MFRYRLISPQVRGIRLPSLPNKASLSKYKLIPPPPGGVTGTVNDTLPKSEPNWFHGSYHWDYERITAVSLIPLTMVPLYGAMSSATFAATFPVPIIDAVLASTILIHSYLGITSCIIDYIPLRKFGFWHKAAKFALALGSSISLYGIYVLETENNGLIDLITALWDKEKGDSRAYLFERRY
ncbi:Succinate dehydrogenase [ubiquinone] cytochrome b small subunit [Kluyveromyces marxianus]|uniref:Succinate dehydrogenase [ubiquinone] cytochrome b small subunit n=1 Tax=Kluyveromyces marxianus (strain DMKU3-1042 / BCC 29191 / NBRC 104275) TaxID=1003335 RepID=W0TDY6_KLUMD|nr:succinate dehydrogenase [ubiquinone] cytochrome b small subunit [Kluyveromyces marxianus DMKU3-1042]KAG0677499.1 hypothetical protein C6P43_003000 [Kluyveromyces marxianus]KAG0684492.1 hypothetical protein C6P41_002294 [Kluyveromyces marxianus]BAO41585.1 succinate dehydrogenase [ubiquinone] cytochrome b small subunit [Kluyveromyces marxianus DMKU3-1042]BAP73024.1 succinate dehydrogenase [ubiquinone] cytochrome b small subunit [Kluyveromyces marxianus]